jgi:diaminopimelate decarboxylase
MNHFLYRDRVLYAEEVPLPRIAEVLGTPFYCYSTATMAHHYRVFAEALAGLPARICYAVKANSNLAVLRTLARLGAGADVVSEGELRRALAAGVAADKIVFSGMGKTGAEMAAALDAGILQFNVESLPELELLNETALSKGARAPVAFRVNPDVDANTHDKIATGRRHDKFGIDIGAAKAAYARAAALPGVEVVGISVHIGSQILDLAPFRQAFTRLARLVPELRADGHNIARIDLGGGLGVPYREEIPPSPKDYGEMVRETVSGLDCEIVVEPGRAIVANAGLLIARVLYIKDGVKDEGGRAFAVVDAAMNDLLRPALYGAGHAVMPVVLPADDTPTAVVDVVGPVCESGDVLACSCTLPELAPGDLLAVGAAGAYGAVMSSTYNSRLLVPEVLVNGEAFAVIRPRPAYRDLLAADRLPDWL